MDPFQYELFFGFPVDQALESALQQVKPQRLDYFISNNGDFLHEVFYEGQRYLGKNVGSTATFDQLELLQKNIQSIVSNLVPHSRVEEEAFIVLALAPTTAS